MFLGKGALEICSNFTGKHPLHSVISIKLLKLRRLVARGSLAPATLSLKNKMITRYSESNRKQKTASVANSTAIETPKNQKQIMNQKGHIKQMVK